MQRSADAGVHAASDVNAGGGVSPVGEETAADGTSPAASNADSVADALRVLHVDDNPDDRALAARALRRVFADLQLTAVGTAEGWAEALAGVRAGAFDLVVTDFRLGWGDGLAVHTAVRAAAPDCPVVMFTNTGNEEVAVAGLQAGLDDYLVKAPGRYERLALAVGRVLERRAAQARTARAEAAADAARARGARLQAVTAALARAVTPEEVARAAVEVGLAPTGATAGVVAVRPTRASADAPEHLAVLAAVGWPAAGGGAGIPAGLEAPLGEAVRTAVPVWRDGPGVIAFPLVVGTPGKQGTGDPRGTVAAAGGSTPADVTAADDAGTPGGRAARAGTRVVGAFGAGFPGGRASDVDARAYLATLAGLTAQALERAWLYAAERGAREEAEAAFVQAQVAYTDAEAARKRAEAARARAAEASRAKSDFVAVMSHELRTPLNAVLGYADLLLAEFDGPLTERQRTYVARQRAAGQHLLTLVTDVLDVAKADVGRLLVTREVADVREAVQSALAMVQPQAAARRVTLGTPALGVPAAGDAGAYVGDPRRVAQVLVNLLSNAVKFTPAGGRVDVVLERRTGAPGTGVPGGEGANTGRQGAALPAWLLVHVRDTGIGVPDDQHAAVFEPFVQLDVGKTRGAGGAGLGLAIARRLARLMDGDLTLNSHAGEGATFTLWLRAASVEAPAMPNAGVPNAGTPSAGAPGAPPGDRRGPARLARGLYEMGDALLRAVDEIVLRYAERVRVDPAISAAWEAPWTELADHTATLLTDVAQALGVIEDAAGEPAELMRIGDEIRTVVSERHGRRRAQLGWTAAALDRDTDILEEEVRAGVRRALPSDPAFPVAEGLEIVGKLLDRARAVARAALLQEHGTRPGDGAAGAGNP